MRRVDPRKVEKRPVARLLGAGQLLADLAPEVVGEPEIGPAVSLRLDGLEVPLQEPLRVGERAVLLDVRRRRQKEDLGRDLLRHELAALDLGPVLPERRALDLGEVAHDEPVEPRHRQPVDPRVRVPDRRVLAEQQVPLDLAVEHAEDALVRGVVTGDPRQVVKAEVVRRGRAFAPPGLEQADEVRPQVPPVAGRRGVEVDVLVEILVRVRMRHRDVAREDVVERRHVRRALDRRVPA